MDGGLLTSLRGQRGVPANVTRRALTGAPATARRLRYAVESLTSRTVASDNRCHVMPTRTTHTHYTALVMELQL